MSRLSRLSLAAAFTLAAAPALAGQATTTRIEPRPFYGATVTLEEGVRVFRPLPVHKNIIINPGNKAAVSVNYSETVEKSYNYNYDQGGRNGDGGGDDAGASHSTPGLPIIGGNAKPQEKGFFGPRIKHRHGGGDKSKH